MSRLNIVKTAPKSQCAPKGARELQELIASTIEASDTDAGGNAIVTTGDTPPDVNSGRALRIHFLRDSENRIIKILYWGLGKWRTFWQVQEGQFGYYLAGTAPEGWFPANGENGTFDVKTDRPDSYYLDSNETIILHQFVGIFL